MPHGRGWSSCSAAARRRARSTSSPCWRSSCSLSSTSRWWCWPGRSTNSARSLPATTGPAIMRNPAPKARSTEMGKLLTRRMFLTGSAAGVSSLVLAGCDQFDFLGQTDQPVRDVLERANSLTYQAQRILGGDTGFRFAPLAPDEARSVAMTRTLAKTFDGAELRQPQRPNGTTDPQTPE